MLAAPSADTATRVDPFVLPERLVALEAALAADGDPAVRVELAWALRQRDTARALRLADEVDAPDLPTAARGRLALLRAEAAWLAGDEAAAQQHAAHAEALANADTALRIDTLMAAAERAERAGGDATAWLEAAAKLTDAAADPVRHLLVQTWLAHRDASAGPADAEARWGRVLAAAAATGHPGLALYVEAFHAVTAYQRGEPARALAGFQRAFAAAQACGQRWPAITLAQNAGIACSSLNDHAGALEWLARALALARPSGWPYATGWCLGQLASTLAGMGRHAEARGHVAEALVLLRPYPRSRNFALASQLLGEVALAEGDLATADIALAEAARAADSLAMPDLVAGTLRWQAVLHSRRGEPVAALAAARRAAQVAEAQGDHRRLATILHATAQVAREHALPAPRGSSAPSGWLHWLDQAFAAGARVPSFTAPPDWHHDCSLACEAVGDLPRALAEARAARQAREATREREAADLAAALRVRHETERALAEAAHQRALAQASAERAAALETLGETRAALERERAQALLVHAGKMLAVGRLATGVMHEISHPVGALLMLGETLRDLLPAAGAAADLVPRMLREAERLQRLTRRLRDFARDTPLDLHPVDLATVLADAQALFAPRLAVAGVALQSALPPGLVVLADAERLALAVANLVANAADALAGRASAWVRITAAGDAAGVTLRLQDNGPGVAEAVRERLFQPFVTTKSAGDGLGLGLALAAESIASMGGRLVLADSGPQGATFEIHLSGPTSLA
jgi:signal transduction histidine kinase